jgi:hypothetical protein
MDFLLDYGYVLVMMIYFCDVMGVGCSEMLFVCLRLWRMGRWARAILTILYLLNIYYIFFILYIFYIIYLILYI